MYLLLTYSGLLRWIIQAVCFNDAVSMFVFKRFVVTRRRWADGSARNGAGALRWMFVMHSLTELCLAEFQSIQLHVRFTKINKASYHDNHKAQFTQ